PARRSRQSAGRRRTARVDLVLDVQHLADGAPDPAPTLGEVGGACAVLAAGREAQRIDAADFLDDGRKRAPLLILIGRSAGDGLDRRHFADLEPDFVPRPARARLSQTTPP